MSSLDLYGYFSMCVVIFSCLLKDVKWLRFWNIIGCMLFVVYGFLIGSTPTVVMNIIIILIHGYHIWKLK